VELSAATVARPTGDHPAVVPNDQAPTVVVVCPAGAAAVVAGAVVVVTVVAVLAGCFAAPANAGVTVSTVAVVATAPSVAARRRLVMVCTKVPDRIGGVRPSSAPGMTV
jgi:hypothetical protein